MADRVKLALMQALTRSVTQFRLMDGRKCCQHLQLQLGRITSAVVLTQYPDAIRDVILTIKHWSMCSFSSFTPCYHLKDDKVLEAIQTSYWAVTAGELAGITDSV